MDDMLLEILVNQAQRFYDNVFMSLIAQTQNVKQNKNKTDVLKNTLRVSSINAKAYWFLYKHSHGAVINVSLLSPGEYVERQLCRDAILPMPIICEVPCPKDCALSTWTQWSLCSHTCSGKNTEGKQTRARSILAYNAGEGKRRTLGMSLLKVTWRF